MFSQLTSILISFFSRSSVAAAQDSPAAFTNKPAVFPEDLRFRLANVYCCKIQGVFVVHLIIFRQFGPSSFESSHLICPANSTKFPSAVCICAIRYVPSVSPRFFYDVFIPISKIVELYTPTAANSVLLEKHRTTWIFS